MNVLWDLIIVLLMQHVQILLGVLTALVIMVIQEMVSIVLV